MKYLIAILIILPVLTSGQTRQNKMPLVTAFEEAAKPSEGNAELVFDNIEFTDEGIEEKANEQGLVSGDIGDFLRTLSKQRSLFEIENDSVVVLHQNLKFSNCTFPKFQLGNVKFKNLIIIHSKLTQSNFFNLSFNILTFGDNEVTEMLIAVTTAKGNSLNIYSAQGESIYAFQNCEFNHTRIYNNDAKHQPFISFQGCTFKSNYIVDQHGLSELIRMGQIKTDSLNKKYNCEFYYKQISFDAGTIVNTSLSFSDCNFLNGSIQTSIALFGSTPESIEMQNCTSEGLVWFSLCKPISTNLQNNNFSYIDLSGLRFNKDNAIINWADIKGKKISKVNDKSFEDTTSFSLYHDVLENMNTESPIEYYLLNKGISNHDLSFTKEYKEMYASYQNFYDYLKSKGDLEGANECYIEMKDLQTSRLSYLYQVDNSFNTYFRWKLAELMKSYTNHGTDPARAITISMWVIILFGVFYFFFPSDWDITSKSKLIQNYRLLVEKNEHGYFKPFISLSVGLMVSLINAFTLSLNSFTTLGFGNIPTHGLARYVCIVEGFIGWFLLSIFTVALINQVLG